MAQREEKGRAGQRLGTGKSCPRDKEREGKQEKETGADRLAPLGSEREREGAREGELPLTGGVRLSGGTGARPGWDGPTGLLSPFLFLWIF